MIVKLSLHTLPWPMKPTQNCRRLQSHINPYFSDYVYMVSGRLRGSTSRRSLQRSSRSSCCVSFIGMVLPDDELKVTLVCVMIQDNWASRSNHGRLHTSFSLGFLPTNLPLLFSRGTIGQNTRFGRVDWNWIWITSLTLKTRTRSWLVSATAPSVSRFSKVTERKQSPYRLCSFTIWYKVTVQPSDNPSLPLTISYDD